LKPHEPIAIVGIGCRFPGAPNPSAFWRVLRDNLETVREYCEKRFDYLDSVYTEDSVRRGLIASRRGGFLPHLDQFDADFFHISRHEAERLDPQQRLLLEVAWEAIEDAGIPATRLAGTKTGVFVGLWNSDYEDCLYENSRSLDFYASTGGGRYPASGRLAYFLDLRGPNLAVDTACSGSLVAVHLACKSLQNDESEVALAGGVNAILRPEITLIYSSANMLSSEGRCKFGDAAANGYVRSEGCGVLVLKTLSRAVADGDSIYALIRGSAVNNDGHSSGLLISPSRDGQQAMLRAAFADAAVDPQSVSYIEAHGTGTLAGDPVEIESIGAVVAGPNRQNPCGIGSVKTNIGHTESAAGVAGIIKVALAMREGLLPASLHFQAPNPAIHWQSIAVHSKNSPWHSGPSTKLIAGVSGFGITGTNAHIVLESADESAHHAAPSTPNRAELFLLSGHSESVLEKSAAKWRDLLASDPSWPSSFADLAYTSATRRTHHDFRCALVAHSREELAERLTSWLKKEDQPGVNSGRRASESASERVAFIFPGQGGQWPGMALGLLRDEPALRQKLEECDAAIFRRTNWHVLDKLQHEPERNFAHIDVIQPVLFSVEVALAALWRSYGVEPHAVAGHSMGEIAAAAVSGALGLDDAAAIICERSALMKGASGRGLMALTELNFDAAQELIRKYDGRVSVAAQNSLNSTVLSGDADAIEDALAALEKKEIFCRRISVDVASHSFHVEPFCQKLPALLAHLQPRKGALPIYSTVTGQVEDGSALNAAYWSKNLRQPVLFHNAIQNLLRDGFDTFIEINAHPVLLQAMEEGIRQSKESSGRRAIAVPSLRRDKEERAELLASLGALHVHGLPINFQKLYPRGTCLRLPTYTWQRERYWLDSTSISNSRTRLGQGHPNLGARVDSSIDPAASLWPVDLPANQNPLDRAALLLEVAIAVAKELSDAADLHFTNLVFHSADAAEPVPGQLAARRAPNGSFELKISSRVGSAWSPEFSAALQQGSAAPAQLTAAQKFPLDTDDKPPLAALFAHLAQASQTGAAEKSVARISKIDQFTWHFAKTEPVDALIAPAGAKLRFDCQLTDSQSHPVADLRGLEFDFVAPSQADNVVYELRWNEIDAQSGAPAPANGAAASRTIIFAAETPLTKNLTKELKSAHEHFAHISSAAALTETLSAAPATRNIIVLSSGSDADSAHALQIAKNIVDSVHAATRAVQSAPPKLWLVTTGTQQLEATQSSERTSIPASQGPAWGLGRVIAREHPELACTNVDLPAKPDHTDLQSLVSLLRASNASSSAQAHEELLAIRASKIYAAHFAHRTRHAPHASRPLTFSPAATYLLTGGTGGIGLELTRWLINSGAKYIAILSRRQPSAAAEQQLQALRGSASQPEIRWFAADLSDEPLGDEPPRDESALQNALAQITREMPPLRGVFHLAATTDGALISGLTPQRLSAVMQPKAHGAWALHRATENSPLDFFVMFSSVAAALSQPGQASYAAANSYMDALARHRRARGLPALSIQWGPWTGVGLALEEGAIRSVHAYQEQGIDTLPLDTALEVLSNLMQSDATNCLVLPVDWQKFAASYSGETVPSLFRELASSSARSAAPEASAAAAAFVDLRQSLTKIPAGPARRTALEKHLQETLASILKTTAQKIDPLKPMGSLGVDSLTALRFVRRLAVTSEVKLPATAVFNFPTIRLLAAELARRMEISLDSTDAAGHTTGKSSAERSNGASPAPAQVTVPADINELSEEDAIRSLLQGSKGGRK
jgi:acyl transferase domain-containing protein